MCSSLYGDPDGSTAALCGMVKETEHQRQIDQEEAYSVTPLLRYSDQSVFDALFAINEKDLP